METGISFCSRATERLSKSLRLEIPTGTDLQRDPRIDQVRLAQLVDVKSLPTPEAENAAWYRLYKEAHNDPSVQQVHREFLLLRDYAGLAVLFLIGFGAVALFTVEPARVLVVYCLLLAAQFVIVRHAAATHGIRFVTTVLAIKASVPARLSRERRRSGRQSPRSLDRTG